MHSHPEAWSKLELGFLRRSYATTPAAEIARIIGRTVGAVRRKAQLIGLEKRAAWTTEALDMLRSLYPTTPAYLLAEQLGHPLGSIYKKAEELGLDKEVIIRRSGPCPWSRKYTFNESAFSQLTGPTAYALGFFVADGNLSKRQGEFSFSNTDRAILEKIRDALDATYPVKLSRDRRPETLPLYRLALHSTPAYESLKSLGMVPCKSLVVQLPPIPDALFFHFLRGELDGDGFVRHTKKYGLTVGFTSGCLIFLQQIASKITALLHIPPPRLQRSQSAYIIPYLGPAALALADAMYTDAGDLFMARKREPVERYRQGRQFRRRRNAWERVGCTEKWCNYCKAIKPRGEFRLCTTKPDGLDGYCRECMKRISRERNARRREQKAAQQQ